MPLGFFEDGVDCLEDVGADRAFFVRVVVRVEEVDAAAFLDGKVDVEEANVLCRAGELVARFAALGAEDVCLFEEGDDFANVAGVGADAAREVFRAPGLCAAYLSCIRIGYKYNYDSKNLHRQVLYLWRAP